MNENSNYSDENPNDAQPNNDGQRPERKRILRPRPAGEGNGSFQQNNNQNQQYRKPLFNNTNNYPDNNQSPSSSPSSSESESQFVYKQNFRPRTPIQGNNEGNTNGGFERRPFNNNQGQNRPYNNNQGNSPNYRGNNNGGSGNFQNNNNYNNRPAPNYKKYDESGNEIPNTDQNQNENTYRKPYNNQGQSDQNQNYRKPYNNNQGQSGQNTNPNYRKPFNNNQGNSPNYRGNNTGNGGNNNFQSRPYNNNPTSGNPQNRSFNNNSTPRPYNNESGGENTNNYQSRPYNNNQGNSPNYRGNNNGGNGGGNFQSRPYNSGNNAPRPNNRFQTKPQFVPKPKVEKVQVPEVPFEFPMRLNRFLAGCGVSSRRKADDLILSGKIMINDVVSTEMGVKVNETDIVKMDGKRLYRQNYVYVLLNKPKDFLTTTDDPEERKTVMQLIKNATNERIYPVGRLDRQTTGLLLLTNDGELTQQLTHPSFEVRKIYHVWLDKEITNENLEEIAEGVELEDGMIKVDAIALNDSSIRNEVGIEIHSGKNRIVRRIFEYFGYQVEKLDRVFYAGLTKKDLPRGTWRYLSENEVRMLKNEKIADQRPQRKIETASVEQTQTSTQTDGEVEI